MPGRIVEIGPVRDVVQHPHHPYTKGLMGAIPTRQARRPSGLVQIPGSMPRLSAIPQGCAFHPRCALRLRPLPHRAARAHAGGRFAGGLLAGGRERGRSAPA